MTISRRHALGGLAAAFVAGCGTSGKRYTGPEVTRITVYKNSRRMYLFHGEKVLKAYNIDLGFAPDGDKKIEGDGRTPEGHYHIDRRNPNSKYFLSLGISYPNLHDIREARAMGKSPGGDIFIHGQPTGYRSLTPDWTWGCIAMSNEDMSEIYAMVQTGTPISIYP